LNEDVVRGEIARDSCRAVKDSGNVKEDDLLYRDFSIVFKDLKKGEDTKYFESQLDRFRKMGENGLVRVEGRRIWFPSKSAIDDYRLLVSGIGGN